MSTVSLLIRVDARPGCEDALAAGLDAALARLRIHTNAGGWTRVRLGPSTFGVFDTRPRLVTARGSGTVVLPSAVLVGLDHLIAGTAQVAHPTHRLRAVADEPLRPLPSSQRLF